MRLPTKKSRPPKAYFIPTSKKRAWVHEEIGFAMALNIPVLPLSIGTIPGEMISQYHCINLTDNLSDIINKITPELIHKIVNKPNVTSGY